MSYAASQRVIYKVGSVVKWLQRTDLQNRRIRLVDLEDKVLLCVCLRMAQRRACQRERADVRSRAGAPGSQQAII